MSPVKQRLLNAIDEAPDSCLEELLTIVEAWPSPDRPSIPSTKIFSILNALAQLTPSISDPIAWQDSLRCDRELPGRSA